MTNKAEPIKRQLSPTAMSSGMKARPILLNALLADVFTLYL